MSLSFSPLDSVPEDMRLVPFSDDRVLDLAATIQHERDRQELRAVIFDLYGPKAAGVCPHDGEEYNDENDYAAMDHVTVFDAEHNQLFPDFSLPFWKPYQAKIAGFIEDLGPIEEWEFPDDEARWADEPFEWLRTTIESELHKRTSEPWNDLAAHYNLAKEPQNFNLPLYQLVPRPVHVLIATNVTQGNRGNDFCFVPEQELVILPPLECSSAERAEICGCSRAFDGLVTDKATTTAMVAILDSGKPGLREAIQQSLQKGGWLRHRNEQDATKLVEDACQQVLRIAAAYPVGTILERDRVEVKPRRMHDSDFLIPVRIHDYEEDEEEDEGVTIEDIESARATISEDWVQNVFGPGPTDAIFDGLNLLEEQLKN